MTTKAQHVAPREGKWSVRTAGAARATAVFPTEREAVERARTIAKNNGSALYIHGKDGRIQARESYDNAPLPKA